MVCFGVIWRRLGCDGLVFHGAEILPPSLPTKLAHARHNSSFVPSWIPLRKPLSQRHSLIPQKGPRPIVGEALNSNYDSENVQG